MQFRNQSDTQSILLYEVVNGIVEAMQEDDMLTTINTIEDYGEDENILFIPEGSLNGYRQLLEDYGWQEEYETIEVPREMLNYDA